MQDYELAELANGQRTAETKKTEGESVAGVAAAIRTGRPETLGPKGMLHLQRAAGNAGVSALVQRQEEESPVHDVINSPGQSLPKETQSFMQEKLGHDFSDVQVHTDGKAAESAKSVQAQAFTVGNHVVFNEGKFNPDTDDGKHTIAHELTHVVQQRNGPVDGTSAPGGVKISDPSDRFEQEAETTAKSALSSESAAPATAGATAGVQRQEEEQQEDEAQLQTLPLQREEEEQQEDEAQLQTLPLQREEEEEEIAD